MTIITKDNKILLVSNKIAVNLDCCCGLTGYCDACSDGEPEELEVVISGVEQGIDPNYWCTECPDVDGTHIVTREWGPPDSPNDATLCQWSKVLDPKPCADDPDRVVSRIRVDMIQRASDMDLWVFIESSPHVFNSGFDKTLGDADGIDCDALNEQSLDPAFSRGGCTTQFVGATCTVSAL